MSLVMWYDHLPPVDHPHKLPGLYAYTKQGF